MKRMLCVAALGLSLMSSAAFAQSPCPNGVLPVADGDSELTEGEVIQKAGRTGGDDSGRSGLAGSGFQLRAGTDEKSEVSLTLARRIDNRCSFGETRIAITAKAPFDEDKGYDSLITRDGVPGGYGGEISITRATSLQSLPLDLRTVSALGEEARRKCEEKSRAKTPPGNLAADCPSNVDERVLVEAHLSKEQISDYNAAMGTGPNGFFDRRMLYWNATAGVGVQDFKFADPATFLEDEQRKVGYSFSGSIGYAPQKGPFFAGIFEYRQVWEAPKPQIRCPVGAGPTVLCKEGVFAPPERDTDIKLSGLVRQGVEIAGVPIGIEVKASYDFEDDIVGVEVPIYAFVDDKGKLRGGFRIGWDSEEDVTFGIFVGLAFDKHGM